MRKPHSGQWAATALLRLLALRPGPAGEDVGQPLHVRPGDHVLPLVVLLAQAVDQLGTQDVDLAVEDPALVRDVDLLLGELLDEVLLILV